MVQGRSYKINDISAFKNELKNYLYYKAKIKELKEELDEVYRIMSGLIGRPFGENGHSTNQSLKEERRLDLIEQTKRIERTITGYLDKISNIEYILNKCSYKDAMVRIYCKQEGYIKLGNELGYSARGLQKRIDKEILLAITPPFKSEKI